MEDAEAVRLTLEGDARGPETLLAKYQMNVYNVSLRLLRNSADAEDVTQDVFLRAFTRLHQYRLGQPFGAWLHGIARNRCLDVLRARRPEAGPGLVEVATSPDAEASALASLQSAQVRAALDRLGRRERALLVLRYWEDLPVATVARNLGMKEGAARVALLRARRALAAELAQLEFAGAV